MLNLPFKNVALTKRILNKIYELAKKPITIMEVCGSHTFAIRRSGLNQLFPENLNVVSGPGCPVCVTDQDYVDQLIYLAEKDFIIAPFGDLSRIPGSEKNLREASAEGAQIHYIYSPFEVIEIALSNPDRKVLFPAIGFETTAPLAAALIDEAIEAGVKNLCIHSSLKRMPPILEFLASDPKANIDAFLLPGHVSAIIGTEPYNFLAEKYGKGGVIAGFEPLDIVQAILEIVLSLESGHLTIENQYRRVVAQSGNRDAISLLLHYFEISSSNWRGMGEIPESGYRLRQEYSQFSATQFLTDFKPSKKQKKGCICGEILKALKRPVDCKLFAKKCTPDTPCGVCMVSSEGTCRAWYEYPDEVKND